MSRKNSQPPFLIPIPMFPSLSSFLFLPPPQYSPSPIPSVSFAPFLPSSSFSWIHVLPPFSLTLNSLSTSSSSQFQTPISLILQSCRKTRKGISEVRNCLLHSWCRKYLIASLYHFQKQRTSIIKSGKNSKFHPVLCEANNIALTRNTIFNLHNVSCQLFKISNVYISW